VCAARPVESPLAQAEVIAAVQRAMRPEDVVVCAAGSLPGDLHKLWRSRDTKGYHLEYGYSCMGYEIAGGLGVRMADERRQVFVMVGDASYLMMAQELVTAAQEGVKLVVVLIDNHGFGSIGALSRSLGSGGFGCAQNVAVDFEANAKSLGVNAVRVRARDELPAALASAREAQVTTVVVVETDPKVGVPSYETFWDVPIAEVSTMAEVREARARYEEARKKERQHL
jgi:3D-(3,5/4)-trihydroxycyclohexane-1,2-dione acylhydrolase (decyclizing)